jgi:hypothetical protein
MTDAPLYCTVLLCDSVYSSGGVESKYLAAQFVFMVVLILLIILIATVDIGHKPK